MPSLMSEDYWSPEERLTHQQTCIENVFYAVKRLLEAKTITEQGDALNYLNNEVDQMATWHPEYDYETGLIGDPYDQ